MNGRCFEPGTIQAFLDGETTPEVSLRLSEHIGVCDACARALAEAEEETSVVFSMLGRELDTLVPTQRLWSRINETIEIENSRTPAWERFLRSVTVYLANPSIAAAAGILLVLGMFAAVVSLREDAGPVVVANGPAIETPRGSESRVAEVTTGSNDGPGTSAPTVAFSNESPQQLEAIAVKVRGKAGHQRIAAQRAVYNPDAYLPDEESYVRTIDDLNQNVETQKETVLTPSTRVSYERDMAVVDDSIRRMREVVRKDPRNQAARQVLYASYQDKIDLLNSIAQREELIASLR